MPGPLDSATREASGSAATAARLRVANPADSAAATPYSVALMTTNTQAGAIMEFQTNGKSLPAATFAPVLVQDARWFKVLVGAYATRAEADSLLQSLRARRQVRAGLGDVVRAPYAFLVDSAVASSAVPGLLAYYADRGQPIYALRQSDGSARLYAGAFESLDQAALFVESLRASGITPVLVYRRGRVN
jgi:cell division septation protein DedD